MARADPPAITISQNERQWLLLRRAFGAFEEHATRDVIAWLRKEYGEDDWFVQAMKAVTATFSGPVLQNRLRAVAATLHLPEDPIAARKALVDHLKTHDQWLYRALQTLKDEAEQNKVVDEAIKHGCVAGFVPMLDWDVYVLTSVVRRHAITEDLTVVNDLELVRHIAVAHRFPTSDQSIDAIQKVVNFCKVSRVGTGECLDTVSEVLEASRSNAADDTLSVSACEWNALCLFRALSAFRSTIQAAIPVHVHHGVWETNVQRARTNVQQKQAAVDKNPVEKTWNDLKGARTILEKEQSDMDKAPEMVTEEDTQAIITWLQHTSDGNKAFIQHAFDINLDSKAAINIFKAHLGCIRAVRNALSHQIALGLRLADKIDKVADALDVFKASVEAQNLRSDSVSNDTATDTSTATVKLTVAATTCSAAEGAGGTHQPQPRLLRVLPTAGFVDRSEDPDTSLASIVGSLAALGSCVVILGDPGIGKSELCKEVLAKLEYDVKFKYTLRGSTLRADLLAFGNNHMGVSGTDDNALKALKAKLTQTGGEWCIALDDAHEASVEDLEWLPVGSGRLLLLGRRSIPVKSTHTVSLKPFSSKESLKLVQTTLGGLSSRAQEINIEWIAECTGDAAPAAAGVATDADGAGGAGGAGGHSEPPFLETELENLPLAVAMFATAVKNVMANIRTPGMKAEGKTREALNTVIKRFRKERTLEEETPGALASATSLRHPGMRYICRMALKDLASCPEALALASMLAVLSPTMTPKFLFEMDGRLAPDVAKLRWSCVFTKAKFNAGLLPLMKCNLVRVAKQEPPEIPFARLTMHALVQKELRGLIDGIVLRDAQEVLRRVLKACYLDIDVAKARGDRGQFRWLEQLTPCVEAFHKSGVVPREGKTGAAARSEWAFRLARVQQELCAYREALAHYEDARCLKVVAYGHEHPDVAATLNGIANVLYSQGNYDECLKKHEEGLQIKLKTLGRDHPNVAATLNGIANVFYSQGKYDESLKAHKEGLDIKIKVHGGREHPDVSATITNMATVYQAQGKYYEALKMYKEGLEIDTKIHGGREHPDVAATLNNIAIVYRNQGKYEEALSSYEESLAIKIKVYGGREHPDVARTLNNIAIVLKAQGNHAEALCKYEESLKIKIAVFGHEHPDVAATLMGIANVHQQQGNYDEALKVHQEGLDIKLKILGHEHPDVAATLQNMGMVLDSQGDYKGALEKYEEAVTIQVKVRGTREHPDVAATQFNMALVHEKQGSTAHAKDLCEASLQTMLKTFGPADTRVKNCQAMLKRLSKAA